MFITYIQIIFRINRGTPRKNSEWLVCVFLELQQLPLQNYQCCVSHFCRATSVCFISSSFYELQQNVELLEILDDLHIFNPMFQAIVATHHCIEIWGRSGWCHVFIASFSGLFTSLQQLQFHLIRLRPSSFLKCNYLHLFCPSSFINSSRIFLLDAHGRPCKTWDPLWHSLLACFISLSRTSSPWRHQT